MPGSSAPRPDAAVIHEWGRRVEAEYRSAALTQELTLWLSRMSAPPALLHQGLRVADDEVVHAELSLAVFSEAGGQSVPTIAPGTLGAPRSGGSLALDVLHCTLRSFCLGETVAVRLFRKLRAHCTVAVARTALDRVLVDEVRHREFGWTLLEWLLAPPDAPDAGTNRREAERILPQLLEEQRRNYGGQADSTTPPDTFPALRRAWGLMPVGEYRQTLHTCHLKDYTRLFGELDITIPPPPRPGD